jgi:hypothetical protein
MIKSIFPIMKNQSYGQIININPQSGVMCEPPFPIYSILTFIISMVVMLLYIYNLFKKVVKE